MAELDDFLRARPRLFGIAYRMLGSATEAEDVLQDAWLRWSAADRAGVREPEAFLVTMVTRLALTALTSARARRERYVGPWLPEPVDTAADPSLGAERAEALELAVLTVMEKLKPRERAAYVLHEAFDYPYGKIGEILAVSEANARQLASRARHALTGPRRNRVAVPEQRRMLTAFLAAARDGDLATLESLLAEHAELHADGGGVANAARRVVLGRDRVARFMAGVLSRKLEVGEIHELNGTPAAVLLAGGTPMGVLFLTVSADGVEEVLGVFNPEKLTVVTSGGAARS